MKRIIAITLALMLCLAVLAGCNKNQQAAGPAGTTQTVGSLTVFVPNGWNLVTDETRDNQVHIVKGGTDPSTCPYVKLTSGGVLPSENLCSDVQTLETRNYGSLSWSGFSGIKPNGNVIYLVTKTNSGSILATLWYTQSPLSLEDAAVRAILGGISVAAPAEPEPAPSEPDSADTPASVTGDWSGQLEIMDCTGDFESKGGVTCKAIARILTDENGNMTPFIGLAEEGGTITNLTATSATEDMGAQISGQWSGHDFGDASFAIVEGKLSIQISIYTENGDALLQMTMSPTSDFEAQAEQLGCTGYPGK